MRLKMIMTGAALAVQTLAMAQKSYSDIYYALPNMTTDQKYADLTAYCAADPEWANTYLQLAVVCENKMALTDPLRDAEAAQFWAKQAQDNYDAFLDIYPKGDARQNPEFYENFGLAPGRKHIEDQDVRDFADQHRQTCANFAKQTRTAYDALRLSKDKYDECVELFASLIAKYPTMDDALYLADEAAMKTVRKLKSTMHESTEAFGRYRQQIKEHPILNYRQLQEPKAIEQYGTDGLTTSDFFAKRFAVWDYEAWADAFLSQFAARVLPLREQMQRVYDAYEAQVAAFEAGQPVGPNKADTDDYRRKLGEAEGRGLATKLMDYLRARGEMMMMSSEMPTQQLGAMAWIDGATKKYAAARALLDEVGKMADVNSVSRFASFYWKNFGGLTGVRGYAANTQLKTLEGINTKMIEKTVVAFPPPAAPEQAYSTKAAKAPALPLWPVGDYDAAEGNYQTQAIARDEAGRVRYVAGVKKQGGVFVGAISAEGQTLWVKDLTKAKRATYVGLVSEGVVVGMVQNELPLAMIFDPQGREVVRFNISEGRPVSIASCAVADGYVGLFGGEDQTASVSVYSANGAKIFDTEIPKMAEPDMVVAATDGLLVVGRNADKAIYAKLTYKGELRDQKEAGSGVARICDARVVYADGVTIVSQHASGSIMCFKIDK